MCDEVYRKLAVGALPARGDECWGGISLRPLQYKGLARPVAVPVLRLFGDARQVREGASIDADGLPVFVRWKTSPACHTAEFIDARRTRRNR